MNEVVLEQRRHELYQSCEKEKDEQIEFLKLKISALTAQLEEAKNLKAANHNLKQHLDSALNSIKEAKCEFGKKNWKPFRKKASRVQM